MERQLHQVVPESHTEYYNTENQSGQRERCDDKLHIYSFHLVIDGPNAIIHNSTQRLPIDTTQAALSVRSFLAVATH